MDVVSLLLPVIETRTLNVPGHGDVIRAAPDFQLLATQRLHNNEGAVVNNAATMLKKMWRRLIIEPLSRSELLTVIEIRYPNLTPLADKLLDAYYLLNGNQEDGKIKFHDRVISPRDFFKWWKIWMFVLQFCKPMFPIEEHFCLQLHELSGVLATLPVRLLWNAAR